MDTLYTILRWTHVIAGFTGLVAFWLPIFTRKGGKNHRFFGKIFKYSAYLVLGAAALSIGLHFAEALGRGIGPSDDPRNFAFLTFLGYLTLVTFIGLRHGLLVLENKSSVTDMDNGINNFLAWVAVAASVGLIGYSLYFNPPIKIVLYALSPIGFAAGFGILKVIKGRRKEKKVWFYEHMGSMIGTGIAFHTAFAVFGSSQLFSLGLSGWTAVIPWIAPALIGIPAAEIWTRYYQRKFNDRPS